MIGVIVAYTILVAISMLLDYSEFSEYTKNRLHKIDDVLDYYGTLITDVLWWVVMNMTGLVLFSKIVGVVK